MIPLHMFFDSGETISSRPLMPWHRFSEQPHGPC